MSISATVKSLVLGSIFYCLTLPTVGQSFYKEKTPKNNIWALGIGPSFIYGDNAGPYGTWDFSWKPSIMGSYTKKFSRHLGYQLSTGIQWISSSEEGLYGPSIEEFWASRGSAFSFSGQAFYLDMMPVFWLFPYENHMNRSIFNLYGGMGLGATFVHRTESYSYDANALEIKANTLTPHVPMRAGINYKLDNWSDLSVEGTILLTFSDELDGNAGFNRFGDHMAQIQVVYKKHFNWKSKAK